MFHKFFIYFHIISFHSKNQKITKDEAKYLVQIINSEGVPKSDINKIQLGKLMNIISKLGEPTKIAKI